jgi:hypothetical protein
MSEGCPSLRLIERKRRMIWKNKGLLKKREAYATRSSAVHKEGIALPHAGFLIY